jgi:hypothetical protein
MNSCAPIARAARSISARAAPGRPKAMLSATAPLNRNQCTGTPSFCARVSGLWLGWLSLEGPWWPVARRPW